MSGLALVLGFALLAAPASVALAAGVARFVLSRARAAHGMVECRSSASAVGTAGVVLSGAAGLGCLVLFADRMWLPQDAVRLGRWVWIAIPEIGWGVFWDGRIDVAGAVLCVASSLWFVSLLQVVRRSEREWKTAELAAAERVATQTLLTQCVSLGAVAWFGLAVAALSDDLAFGLLALQAVSWFAARIPGCLEEWSRTVAGGNDGAGHRAGLSSGAPPAKADGGWIDRRLLLWWWLADVPAGFALVMLSAQGVGWSGTVWRSGGWAELVAREPAVANAAACCLALTVLGRAGLLPWLGVHPRLERLAMSMGDQLVAVTAGVAARAHWRRRLREATEAPAQTDGDASEPRRPRFDETVALADRLVYAACAAQCLAAFTLLWRAGTVWAAAKTALTPLGTLAALSTVWLGLVALTAKRPLRVILSAWGAHAGLVIGSGLAGPDGTPGLHAAVVMGMVAGGVALLFAWGRESVRSLDSAGDASATGGSLESAAAGWARSGHRGWRDAMHYVPAVAVTLGGTGGATLVAAELGAGNTVVGRLLLTGWLILVFAVWRMTCRAGWGGGLGVSPAERRTAVAVVVWCGVGAGGLILAWSPCSDILAERWPDVTAVQRAGRFDAPAATFVLVVSLSVAAAVLAWMRFRLPWSLPVPWRDRLGAALRLLENQLYVEPFLDVAGWSAVVIARGTGRWALRAMDKAGRFSGRRLVRPAIEALDASGDTEHEALLVPLAVLVTIGLVLVTLWRMGW
ncbi:MAG: hypothetical protein D6725_06350 [Planctomycetota bacterium]|nr:MAG: hypothetical protein D6725_06350 [Planctomycetota bacterium]